MDRSSIPSSKRQWQFGGLNVVGDNVDRISKLPDEVLSHILSFLPTKTAVATSILSKRWEYLWTSTPDLDFSDQFHFHSITDYSGYITKLRSFKDYVDRVIFHHGWTVLRRCHLHIFTDHVSPNIYAWVCAVITCKVQELSIKGSFFTVQELPCSLFICKTLVVLKIKGMFLLDLPYYICFPCLKILCVEDVIYGDNAFMQRFFSSCPVLEDLAIRRNKLDGVEKISISIPSLKRLSIHSGVRIADAEINTPCLEYLKLGGISAVRYSVNFSSSLVEVQIDCGCDFGLITGISQVKYLVLTGKIMWDLGKIVDKYDLPTFNNLKKLELYVGTPVNWELLPDLLDCSPNLEVLVFPEGLVVPKESGRDYYRFYWHQPDFVPECLLLHLKTVEIFNFVGLPGELYLVEYLLESGEVLDKMTIHRYDFSSRPRMRKKMEGVEHEVLSFERSSSICQVVFTT